MNTAEDLSTGFNLSSFNQKVNVNKVFIYLKEDKYRKKFSLVLNRVVQICDIPLNGPSEQIVWLGTSPIKWRKYGVGEKVLWQTKDVQVETMHPREVMLAFLNFPSFNKKLTRILLHKP